MRDPITYSALPEDLGGIEGEAIPEPAVRGDGTTALLAPTRRSDGEGQPLVVDLYCGLGGWTEGFLAEGYRARGYDIEAHEYGEERYPGELVVRDVLQMHGSEVADADVIVASPPCQEFSYMAMPWGRAKQIGRALRGEDAFPEGYKGSRTTADLTALFDACFRIQREANEVRAARGLPPISMVVENVKGAQPWVGRAPWSFGSYFLWGDIPALMPIQRYHERLKVKSGEQWNVNRENFTGTRGWDEGLKNPGFRFDGSGKSFQSESVNRHVAPTEGFKSKGMDWSNRNLRGQDFTAIAGAQAEAAEGVKNRDADGYERDHPAAFGWKAPRTSSGAKARKAASAKIAKIPFALSTWIARCYLPEREAA